MAQAATKIYRPDPPHWFKRMGNSEHSNGNRSNTAQLTLDQTKAAGLDFANALIAQSAVRASYYNLSRTWHDLYKPGADPATLISANSSAESSKAPSPYRPIRRSSSRTPPTSTSSPSKHFDARSSV